jgi:hypothetical protein
MCLEAVGYGSIADKIRRLVCVPTLQRAEDGTENGMKPGFNPVRRNRNIGTARQGHGQDNRLVIPNACSVERDWTEQLHPHIQIRQTLSGRQILFIVEKTHGGCIHACSVDDIRHILAAIPSGDWRGLDTFVLRQSTRKQRVIRPAWGRMCYAADLGLPGRTPIRVGPVVMLEAVDCSGKFAWPSALQPEDQAELERLRADGHEIRQDGNHHIFSMTPESVRATQLYRTLIHEIGHWVDFVEKVEKPTTAGDGAYTSLSQLFFSRSHEDREAFAHRYADAVRGRLVKFGIIPFDRL